MSFGGGEVVLLGMRMKFLEKRVRSKQRFPCFWESRELTDVDSVDKINPALPR